MDIDMGDMNVTMSMNAGMGVNTGMNTGMPMGGSTEMNMNMTTDEAESEFNGDPTGATNLGAPVPMATSLSAGITGSEGNGGLFTQPGAETSKRLHLLQGRLVRGVMHAAGLNPRAFRYVSLSFLSILDFIFIFILFFYFYFYFILFLFFYFF
jgi:hypothetical protein